MQKISHHYHHRIGSTCWFEHAEREEIVSSMKKRPLVALIFTCLLHHSIGQSIDETVASAYWGLQLWSLDTVRVLLTITGISLRLHSWSTSTACRTKPLWRWIPMRILSNNGWVPFTVFCFRFWQELLGNRHDWATGDLWDNRHSSLGCHRHMHAFIVALSECLGPLSSRHMKMDFNESVQPVDSAHSWLSHRPSLNECLLWQ